MNELTTPTYQRQISDVTQDIRRKTGEFLITAIEIGRLLFEAKSMVEPGGWSKYIEEELPFSHSWANNYMKLYTEFGSDQTSLFGNSQTFMKLRPTQALEVLRLPEDQREAFVESHDVEDMSTRQLRQAVQDQLDEERRKHADTQKKLESAEAQVRDTNQKLLDAQQVASEAKSNEGAWREQISVLNAALDKAKATAENNRKLLADARTREETALADLKKARENPNVPDAVMEQMRKEIEADAAQQAAAKAQKDLDAAEQRVQDAIKAKEAADAALAEANARTKEAEDKLAAAQKNQKMSDQDLMAVQTLGQQMLAMANSINGHRMKAVMKDENNAKAINGYLTYIVNELRVSFGIKADALEKN